MVIPAKKEDDKKKPAGETTAKDKDEKTSSATAQQLLDEEDDFEEFKLPSSASLTATTTRLQRSVSKDHLDKAQWDDEDAYDAFQENLKKEILNFAAGKK
ncbi:unnamed protein product [Amoebophrya sp. A120]|nr:unnamed protein product [Amoebophrya sp. A120]|eukprot:GSA120T00015881001.1